MITNPFKDFFYYTKSDRRAVVALGCIAVFCVGVLLLADAWKTQEQTTKAQVKFDEEIKEERKDFVLQKFDPNNVDSLTLVRLGIKGWKVKNFLHYRAAGKVFRSALDMGKTYGWTKEDVERVAPYVQVAKGYQKEEKYQYEKKARQAEQKEAVRHDIPKKIQSFAKVDVNEADTLLLRRIPGIGEKISEAIVRYRTLLGGFNSVNQLLEIKIVSPELLEWFIVSDTSSLRKININEASFQKLNSHPYISYEHTKALLQYIRLYGKVKDEETLLSTGIFVKEDLEKLRPYITYE